MGEIDLPEGSEQVAFELEILGVPDIARDEFFPAFEGEGEEVLFSHSFGGVSSLIVAARLTSSVLAKLVILLNKMRLPQSKTVLKVSGKSFTVEASSGDELLRIIQSPGFQELVRGAARNG